MNKDKNIFTVNDTVLYKNKEHIISRFETLNNALLVGLVNLNHLVNLKDIEHISSEYKILETRISNNLQQVIWKVKRLSDGEIFTIGDKYEVMNPIKETRTIASFHLSDNTLVIHPEEFGYSLLNDISFLKKPLFTTEDGVDIFENKDGEIKYWTLYNENSQCKANIWKISDAPIIVKNLIPHRTEVLKRIGLLRFSTKEAAEEYRLMNKPCLSIEEVMSVAYNPVESRTSSSRKLKEIVKSKL